MTLKNGCLSLLLGLALMEWTLHLEEPSSATSTILVDAFSVMVFGSNTMGHSTISTILGSDCGNEAFKAKRRNQRTFGDDDRILHILHAGSHDSSADNPGSSNSQMTPSSSSSSSSSSLDLIRNVFPVLSQIQDKYWEGTCRYVNGDLQPQLQLKLTGGTRFVLQPADVASMITKNTTSTTAAAAAVTLTLTSFLVFPDGRTRQVRMQGNRRQDEQRPSTRLDPVEAEMGEGPVYMVVTEVPPDTVLLNEVEKESGRIILTSTLSFVHGEDGNDRTGVSELILSSHEVGGNRDMPIEGHQIWRYQERTNISRSAQKDL